MNEENENILESLIIPSLFGVGISVALLLASVIIFSAVAYFMSDPLSSVTAVSLASLFLSASAAGFAGAKKSDSVVGGIISGVILSLLLFTVSLFFKGDEVPYSYLFRLGAICISSVFAVIAAKKGGKRGNIKIGAKPPKLKRIK